MRRVRPLTVLLAIAASLVLAACGQEAQDEGGYQTENAQVAETEGIYIALDGMKYQVQVSRQLNPLLVDDRDYLNGISAVDRLLRDDEEWFAVFLRVENEVEEPVRATDDFEVVDSQENVYRPLEYGPDNVFAYRPDVVQGKELYPLPNSPAGERQPSGAVLLFKIRRFSLDNRPLELIIEGNEGERASVALDV